MISNLTHTVSIKFTQLMITLFNQRKQIRSTLCGKNPKYGKCDFTQFYGLLIKGNGIHRIGPRGKNTVRRMSLHTSHASMQNTLTLTEQTFRKSDISKQ